MIYYINLYNGNVTHNGNVGECRYTCYTFFLFTFKISTFCTLAFAYMRLYVYHIILCMLYVYIYINMLVCPWDPPNCYLTPSAPCGDDDLSLPPREIETCRLFISLLSKMKYTLAISYK